SGSGGSDYSGQSGAQASYQQPSGCSSCNAQASTYAAQGSNYAPQTSNYGSQPQYQYPPANTSTVVAPPGTTVIQQNGAPATTTDARPNMNTTQQPPQNTYKALEAPQQVQPTPGA